MIGKSEAKRFILVIAVMILTGGLAIYFFSVGMEVPGTVNLIAFLVNCVSLAILIYCYRRD